MTSKAQPFLGGPAVPFAQAFPNIGAFKIDVAQGDMVWGKSNALGAARTYTAANPPPAIIPCINPNCRAGGLDLETYLHQANGALPWSLDETFRCHGDEGKQVRSCFNAFRVSMRCEAKTV